MSKDETLEWRVSWWSKEDNVSWFRECPQSPYQTGDHIRLCFSRARRHRRFARALSSALVLCEIDYTIELFPVVFYTIASTADRFRPWFVATWPSVRTTTDGEKKDGRKCWFEVTWAIFTQSNFRRKESLGKFIDRRDQRQTTTTIPRHKRQQFA